MSNLIGLVRFQFGDTPDLIDQLTQLVLAGVKTATCSAIVDYQKEASLPKPGDRAVALNSAGRPACVIETTSVELRQFDMVDAAFAHDEGEGDRSLTQWRQVHEAYFRRQGTFVPDMMLVCERFRLVEVFKPR